jgi:hypothetical protein
MVERRTRRFATGAALSLALVSCADANVAQSASNSESHSVQVSAMGPDTYAGKVRAGDKVSITASGSWRMDHRSLPPTGPEGYPPEIIVWGGNKDCLIDRNKPYGTLIARIGEATIPVGDQKTFVAPETGPLILGPNDIKDDQKDCRADNRDGVTDGDQNGVVANITVFS